MARINEFPRDPPFIVGKIKQKIEGKLTYWTYRNIKYDNEGWADGSIYLPDQFDLCILKTEKEKVIKGWHTGQIWDGLNVKILDKIKFWKWFEEKE